MDANYLCERLRVQGFAASVEASNIQGSPYDYVYVWFGARWDGPFCIISDVREHSPKEHGYYVGFYKDSQALTVQGPGPQFVKSWEEAVRVVRNHEERLST